MIFNRSSDARRLVISLATSWPARPPWWQHCTQPRCPICGSMCCPPNVPACSPPCLQPCWPQSFTPVSAGSVASVSARTLSAMCMAAIGVPKSCESAPIYRSLICTFSSLAASISFCAASISRCAASTSSLARCRSSIAAIRSALARSTSWFASRSRPRASSRSCATAALRHDASYKLLCCAWMLVKMTMPITLLKKMSARMIESNESSASAARPVTRLHRAQRALACAAVRKPRLRWLTSRRQKTCKEAETELKTYAVKMGLIMSRTSQNIQVGKETSTIDIRKRA
mmetsp:Transcript_18297/g.38706  ORF Transcript_18297/g.38706 Transcript_18297/m.38706 type:complete len:287 (-) Transcript_18297:589-1449(-)